MAAVLSCLGAPAALKGPRSVAARSVPRPAPALARHAKRSAGAARGSALVVSATALAGEVRLLCHFPFVPPRRPAATQLPRLLARRQNLSSKTMLKAAAALTLEAKCIVLYFFVC